MAKAGFGKIEELYQRRDPVSGETKTFGRTPNSRQSSPALKAFQKCVRKGMDGYKASGSTPKERSQNLRSHFTQVTTSCRGAR